jgi:hypothetical protein
MPVQFPSAPALSLFGFALVALAAFAYMVDEAGEWATLYGIGPEGAALVRPDGHVAWRTQASASEENLESAMRSILDRRMASVLPDSRRERMNEKILY